MFELASSILRFGAWLQEHDSYSIPDAVAASEAESDASIPGHLGGPLMIHLIYNIYHDAPY